MRFDWFVKTGKESQRRGGRGVFGWIGPTWRGSPVRRLIQACCFIVFLVLFGYVAWPYTAHPARIWPGWIPEEVDAETGALTLVCDVPPNSPLQTDQPLVLFEPEGDAFGILGYYRLEDADADTLRLMTAKPPTEEQLDRLSTTFGPWTLAEKDPNTWPSHYADNLQSKELLAAESLLTLDPLVSLTTALAARTWVWSLACAGVILAICLVVPRGFCGYVCPLGTLIDLVDWAVCRRIRRFRVPDRGWWNSLKFALLAATLAAALCGVLLSGFVAALPVITRGLAFILSPVQLGFTRGWHQVPAIHGGHLLSLGLFILILMLGLLRPRFWCQCVCPTGAIFSLSNLLRLTSRKVQKHCIACGKCVEICPFNAVQPDFSTRGLDCTFCQTCGGVCPADAVRFDLRGRSEISQNTRSEETLPENPSLGRRGFIGHCMGVFLGTSCGVSAAVATRVSQSEVPIVVRPPGSVSEPLFLQLCIRCGECFQACPNNVLQPMGIEQGLDRLWTPRVMPNWSGCEPSCNNCGHVCPTGAIRSLALKEKRAARMGLAEVNLETCLPHAGLDACRLCVDECTTAGYRAIEFRYVGTQMDPFGQPIEDSGFLAPVVLADRCVGCGLCQTRCHAIHVKENALLAKSAIVVVAGKGKEDRIMSGSYLELRRAEQQREQEQREPLEDHGDDEGYLPDFLK